LRSTEVLVRERGVQSRRARAAESGPNLAGSPSGGGPGVWPALAIIAVIIATAGWTTVGVLVLNKPAAVATAPAGSDVPIDEESLPPEDAPLPESHLFPDLEALLPAQVAGTPLSVQSFTGTDFIIDDGWGTSMTAFLTSVGKTPADLQLGHAEDPDGVIDLDAILVFRLDGVEPETLRDAIINGWRTDFPDLTTSTATVVDKEVTKGAFGEDAIGSIWYIHDGLVYDIESYDEALATTILAALPPATTPPASAPAASAPAASASASASAAP
jgi:hypothetical protein